MSQARTIQSNEKKVKHYTSEPLRIVAQLFDYYKGREYALVQLCYRNGIQQDAIAEALQVDPSLISKNYPKERTSK